MKLNQKLFTKAAALAVGIILFMSVPNFTADALAAPPAGGEWTLLPAASDEFDGSALDTAKWNNGIWYDVTTDLAFKAENVSVSGGNLVLTAKKENFNGKAYTAGAVESKFEVPGTDSYVEVRAKMLDSRANVLSAIWMQSSPLTAALNPNPEIDIMETFNFSSMYMTLHTWQQSPSIHLQRGHKEWNTGVADVSSDYHIYGLERRDNKLRFYFDGQLAWEKTTTVDSFVQQSRHMVLSLEGHLGKPVDSYLPSAYLIDYVRTYYNSNFTGIPEDGIYKIVNRNSGKVLNVPGGSLEDKTQLIQYTYASGDNEKWVLTKNDDNTYFIKNVGSGKYVDLKGDSGINSNGNAILQYQYNGNANQKWYIVPTDSGYFRIMSQASGKALCVKDASAADGAKIIQWTYEGADTNDEWSFEAP